MNADDAEKAEAQPPLQEDAALPSLTDTVILSSYPDIGNPKDVSRALRVPETSVRELCRTGKLRAFKVGTLWKIPKIWLIEFIESNASSQSPNSYKQGGDALWHG